MGVEGERREGLPGQRFWDPTMTCPKRRDSQIRSRKVFNISKVTISQLQSCGIFRSKSCPKNGGACIATDLSSSSPRARLFSSSLQRSPSPSRPPLLFSASLPPPISPRDASPPPSRSRSSPSARLSVSFLPKHCHCSND